MPPRWGKKDIRVGEGSTRVEEHRGRRLRWSPMLELCVLSWSRVACSRRSHARPHTGVEAGGGWMEKRKGRRRWPRGRSPRTHATDVAAPEQEEIEGSSGVHMLVRRALGWGTRDLAWQRSIAIWCEDAMVGESERGVSGYGK